MLYRAAPAYRRCAGDNTAWTALPCVWLSRRATGAAGSTLCGVRGDRQARPVCKRPTTPPVLEVTRVASGRRTATPLGATYCQGDDSDCLPCAGSDFVLQATRGFFRATTT